MKGRFMTVIGVNGTTGFPVAATQNLNNTIQHAASSSGTLQPVVYEEPKKSLQ